MTGAHPSRHARGALAVCATVAVFGVGWGIGRSGGRATAPTAAPAEAAAAPVRPAAGSLRTPAGAVDAARRYARLYASPQILDSGARADLFIRTALPGAARRFEASYRKDLPTLRHSLGLPAGGDGPSATLLMRTVGVGHRVSVFTRDRASVRLWVVLILGNGAAVIPQAAWRSVHVDLAWRDGGWRVADLRDGPGPTPALLGVPSPAGLFADDQARYQPDAP